MAINLRRDQPAADKRSEFAPRRRRSSFSGPLVFVAVVVAAIFAMSVFFRVSDIRVIGNEHYTAEEIINAVDIENGDNLFFFDRIAAGSRVFAKLPSVEAVSVDSSLPNRVTITVIESKAIAYLILGEERWTLDHNCKVLGKAADGETGNLVPVVGIAPGTLMIGEKMQTEDMNDVIVEHLAEVLTQVQDRGLVTSIRRVDFSDANDVQLSYGSKYTVKLGNDSDIEHKFGMFVAVLDKLMAGDVGIIDVSDGKTAHFSPN